MNVDSSTNSEFNGYRSIYEEQDELSIDARLENPFKHNCRIIHKENSSYKFKCPECEGEFGYWITQQNGIGEDETKHCPFCGLEQFSYEPDK